MTGSEKQTPDVPSSPCGKIAPLTGASHGYITQIYITAVKVSQIKNSYMTHLFLQYNAFQTSSLKSSSIMLIIYEMVKRNKVGING